MADTVPERGTLKASVVVPNGKVIVLFDTGIPFTAVPKPIALTVEVASAALERVTAVIPEENGIMDPVFLGGHLVEVALNGPNEKH